MRRNQKGFTLMELMVVIVIVAILAAVAVPLYLNYVRDAQRTEAKGAIGAIIAAQQVYYQKPENQQYATSAATSAEVASILGVDLTESQVNWDFALSANGDPTDGFKVTATGVSGRPTENLSVEYTHSRANPAPNPWTEQ
jgi:type IV pilus assembly protein PilE